MSAPESAALRRWREDLERAVEGPVEVVFGRSRTYPIQVRRGLGEDGLGRRVRLHEIFAAAPDDVRTAVARWMRSGRRSKRADERLARWMEATLRETPPARPEVLEPRGRCHDLTEILSDVLTTELAGELSESELPRITWGRRVRSRGRRSLRLGSLLLEERLIRIHPVLDQQAVPRWFVRAVVFHELLHAVLPPVRTAGGKWVHHGPEFRRREAAYRDHARVEAWQETNLPRLMRSARTGSELRNRERMRESTGSGDGRQLELF